MPETNAMDQFRLDNRVALVTGGSKGLGKSMALGLAQAGATTVICSRHMDECGAVAAEIAAETGRESVGIAVDVTQEGDVDRLFDAVQQRFGRLDVLVNSAGVNIRHLIEDFPTDDFRQVIDINLTGTWFCCRAAGRIMKPQGKASVINIGFCAERGRSGGTHGLLRLQGGHPGPDPDAGPGMGAVRHTLQRHLPGAVPHGNQQAAAGRTGKAAGNRGTDRPQPAG